MSGIRHIGDLRRRKDRRLQALDTALDATLAEVDAARGQFDAELAAARALALSVESEPLPAQALVTLRAGLAARDGNRRSRRSQWVRGGVPGAVAASVVGLLAYAAVGDRTTTNPSTTAVATAAQTLQVINQRMAKVQTVVDQHNRPEAQAQGQSARQALLEARQQAVSLPPDSAVRDLLLTEAYAKIAQLTRLLAQLQLTVPALPPVPAGSGTSAVAAPDNSSTPGGSTSTSSTPTSSPTSTSTAPTSTTTPQSGSSTTTSTTEPGTTTTTSTTPSSTTTTTTEPGTTTTTSVTTTTVPGSSDSGTTTTTSTSTTSTTSPTGGNSTTDNGTASNVSKPKLTIP